LYSSSSGSKGTASEVGREREEVEEEEGEGLGEEEAAVFACIIETSVG
jgi:hypothetical protein